MSKQKTKEGFVQISSTRPIMVTCGVQFENVTPDSDIPNRLRVLEKWSRYSILLKSGAGIYPAEIVDWPTVKALAEAKIITIGQTMEETTDADALKEKQKVEDMKKEQASLEQLSEEEK